MCIYIERPNNSLERTTLFSFPLTVPSALGRLGLSNQKAMSCSLSFGSVGQRQFGPLVFLARYSSTFWLPWIPSLLGSALDCSLLGSLYAGSCCLFLRPSQTSNPFWLTWQSLQHPFFTVLCLVSLWYGSLLVSLAAFWWLVFLVWSPHSDGLLGLSRRLSGQSLGPLPQLISLLLLPHYLLLFHYVSSCLRCCIARIVHCLRRHWLSVGGGVMTTGGGPPGVHL